MELIGAFIIGLLLSTQTSATSMKKYMAADLLTVTPQAHTLLAEQRPVGGDIVIDVITGEIKLTLNLPGTCPKGVMCIWAGPAPLVYAFETEKVERGSCGEVVRTSKTQPLEEGGALSTLTVTDYSNLTCRIFPAAWTEIELDIHGFIGEHHTMTAERLK